MKEQLTLEDREFIESLLFDWLAYAISEISEKAWSCSWYEHIEREVFQAVERDASDEPVKIGMCELKPLKLERFRRFIEVTGKWVNDSDLSFVPVEEFRAKIEKGE